ncbi:class I SAM-dependent methyltransferase [Planobispora takensis]|uniref:Type 11 methyltransferase n=1 Tax=Planobispora takensis TaxID=1367882 RepID=A0A8J3WR88_9ACTN|nr:class I SAM-dependent methyltransferase [Planobispora takensis]GIH99288.1 type 11 methyltransferase [Planobispora takensis]
MNGSSAFGDIDPEALSLRASSFGGQAAAYARERPGYPDAAVRWSLEPVSGPARPRVLDLGAGTGKLTESLLRLGADVVAVEPDPAMLAQLHTGLPSVRAMRGSAEEIPLPDASVEAVLVGQAMHWFDLDRALPEIRRVLAPGGVLAGLWNLDDDRISWVRGLKEVARSTVSFRQWHPGTGPLEGRGFRVVERAEFAHGQRRTAESMAATIATHSHALTLPEAERTELLARVLGYLRSTPETADGEFELPIVTVAVRALTG